MGFRPGVPVCPRGQGVKVSVLGGIATPGGVNIGMVIDMNIDIVMSIIQRSQPWGAPPPRVSIDMTIVKRMNTNIILRMNKTIDTDLDFHDITIL